MTTVALAAAVIGLVGSIWNYFTKKAKTAEQTAITTAQQNAQTAHEQNQSWVSRSPSDR